MAAGAPTPGFPWVRQGLRSLLERSRRHHTEAWLYPPWVKQSQTSPQSTGGDEDPAFHKWGTENCASTPSKGDHGHLLQEALPLHPPMKCGKEKYGKVWISPPGNFSNTFIWHLFTFHPILLCHCLVCAGNSLGRP